MKAEELTDVSIEIPKARVCVELPNGQRASISDYFHDSGKDGEPIIVLKAGRVVKKCKSGY